MAYGVAAGTRLTTRVDGAAEHAVREIGSLQKGHVIVWTEAWMCRLVRVRSNKRTVRNIYCLKALECARRRRMP